MLPVLFSNTEPVQVNLHSNLCTGQANCIIRLKACSFLQVCLFAFDCLYLNGEPLLDAPLTRRREALRSAVTERTGELQFAVFKVSHYGPCF